MRILSKNEIEHIDQSISIANENLISIQPTTPSNRFTHLFVILDKHSGSSTLVIKNENQSMAYEGNKKQVEVLLSMINQDYPVKEE